MTAMKCITSPFQRHDLKTAGWEEDKVKVTVASVDRRQVIALMTLTTDGHTHTHTHTHVVGAARVKSVRNCASKRHTCTHIEAGTTTCTGQ